MFLGSSNSTQALGLRSTISIPAATIVPLPLLWGDRRSISAESYSRCAKSACGGHQKLASRYHGGRRRHVKLVGDRPQGVAGDCNSLAETHAWFDSRVAHHFTKKSNEIKDRVSHAGEIWP